MKKPVAGRHTTHCANCPTKDCSVLKNCTPDCLDLITKLKKVGYFIAGQRILMEGSHAKGIYFIETGQVKIYKSDSRGQEIILRFAKPGDVIGFSTSVDTNEYMVSAMALTDTTVCYLDYSAFMELTERFPELAIQLLQFYRSELSSLEQKSLKLATMTVPQKVADAILVMESAFGSSGEKKPLNLILSRQDIASLAGTTKEQVSKVISELNSQRIVDTQGKLISILQPEKLADLARI
ncbi:MAG: Crp/Fnr family transcriptional regulator [Bacteroidetes bacterium]|nr:MAG: Crp/Fnr family transcriptional regulator [Bacteroidota bacterium]